MVERQVQSVGDYFQNRVDNLVHQMHSCRLGEQVKSGLLCIIFYYFVIQFSLGNAYKGLVEILRNFLWTCVKE